MAERHLLQLNNYDSRKQSGRGVCGPRRDVKRGMWNSNARRKSRFRSLGTLEAPIFSRPLSHLSYNMNEDNALVLPRMGL